MSKISPLVLFIMLSIWLLGLAQIYSAYVFNEIKISSFALLLVAILATGLILNYTRQPSVDANNITFPPVNYKSLKTWGPALLYLFNFIPFIKLWNTDNLGLAGIFVFIWGTYMFFSLPFAIIPLITRDHRLSHYMGNSIYFMLSIPTLIIIIVGLYKAGIVY